MELKFKRRPKLRLQRLSDEQRTVSIQLKIPISDQKFMIDTFDWNLKEDEIILPSVFAQQFVNNMNLPQNYTKIIQEQIQYQIVDYIEKNTFFPRNRNKVPEKPTEEDYIPPAKLKKYQRFNTTQFTKRVCKFCKNCHKNLVIQCVNCKFPFRILESLNLRDKEIKESLTFFHLCYQKFDAIRQSSILDDLQIEDFQTLEVIQEKLKYSFKDLFTKTENINHIQQFIQNLDQVGFLIQNIEVQVQKKPDDFEQIQISSESDVTQKDFEIKRSRGRPKRSKTYKKLLAFKKKIKLL